MGLVRREIFFSFGPHNPRSRMKFYNSCGMVSVFRQENWLRNLGVNLVQILHWPNEFWLLVRHWMYHWPFLLIVYFWYRFCIPHNCWPLVISSDQELTNGHYPDIYCQTLAVFVGYVNHCFRWGFLFLSDNRFLCIFHANFLFIFNHLNSSMISMSYNYFQPFGILAQVMQYIILNATQTGDLSLALGLEDHILFLCCINGAIFDIRFPSLHDSWKTACMVT